MRNCLLLGGGGFIGSNLARQLKDSKYNITVYDRNIEKKTFPGPFTFIEGDFFQEPDFSELLRNQDIIVHAISSVSPASSAENPGKAYTNDVMATLNLLENCRQNNVDKIVFLSSGGTVYGRQDHHPIKESYSTNPINHYGIMKLTIEKMLLMYNENYGMRNVIMRVANPYGSGQNSGKKIGALTVFLEMILNDREITIYGKGDIVRDYVEISDVTSALIAGIQYETTQEVTPVFNIGTGKGTSINELIATIEKVTQRKARINYMPERSIDAKYNVLDITKTSEHLGFQPLISIEQGVRALTGNYY